ncbi:zinc ribbon domain-containing protein [Aphanizomenon sp. CS-733/32]|uniref:zinc ribbon domain-containing protein n=1 Tax=Aphanizomenon sp. CS-733/32 TaxID=3021715 RepID=UPI00232DFDF9|nr:zinc ribbon domain-containing protein [Aphanizomenon sp. CS-733/32]MDB9308552.1 zinc ribbon domain-containing protein [Aphanizomenon sp. CS-733/32]
MEYVTYTTPDTEETFSQTLEHLCNRYGSKLARITEEYTSKTCTKCGHVHRKLDSSTIPCPFSALLG